MRVTAPGFRLATSFDVSFSPDHQFLASVGRNVALWSVADRRRLRSISLLRHPSYATFSPHADLLAIKNTFGELLISETATGDPIGRFVPAQSDEGAEPYFLDEEAILDASWDGTIRVRPVATLQPIAVWHAPGVMVTCIACSASRDRWAFLVAAKHDHPDGHEASDAILTSSDPRHSSFAVIPLSRRFARNIALAPAGDRVAVRCGTTDHHLEIREWSGAPIAVVPITQGGTGWAMAWAPDGEHIVVVEAGGFSFRNAKDLSEVGWLAIEYPSAVAFAPSAGLIALGGWQGGMVLRWPELLGALEPRPA